MRKRHRLAQKNAGYPDDARHRTAEDAADKERPTLTPKVSESAVLDELRSEFGDAITKVTIQASGSGLVRIDVRTAYPEAGSTAKALEVAKFAAGSSAVVKAYPSCTISAYAWLDTGHSYITRATAVYVDGKLAQPLDTFPAESS